jgi:hypothetical protein
LKKGNKVISLEYLQKLVKLQEEKEKEEKLKPWCMPPTSEADEADGSRVQTYIQKF